MLGASRDLDGDVDLAQLDLQDARSLGHMSFTVGAALADHCLDLLELARMQRLECEVLQLPLHRVDTEPVRERRIDLERLFRLLDLLLLAEVLDLAQVVQPVGQLDQDHTHVCRHRDDQLPVVLGLGLLTALELHARQLRDALDELRNLVAELGTDTFQLDVGVLDDVVQERRGDRLVVESELGADLGDPPGVEHELLTRTALLPLVGAGGEKEGPPDQVSIDAGVVGGDSRNQLVDELLMLFMSLNDSHTLSVLRGYLAPFPRSRGRNSRAGTGVPMMKEIRPCTGTDADKNAEPPCEQHGSSLRSTLSPGPARSARPFAEPLSAPPASTRSRTFRADRSRARGTPGHRPQAAGP